MWVRGLGWERIPRGLRRRSNRGDSFSPPSVLAAEMMSACGEPPLKTPKNQFPAVASDRANDKRRGFVTRETRIQGLWADFRTSEQLCDVVAKPDF